MTDKSITFFFPYHQVSGVPVLFSRLSHLIAQQTNLKVYLIDYSNGAMARLMDENSKIELIIFKNSEHLPIPENTTVIMQASLPARFKRELIIPESSKILFWVLHPDNLVPVLLPIRGLRDIQNNSFYFYKFLSPILNGKGLKQTNEFVLKSLKHNGLYFMDQSTLEKTNKYLGLNIEKVTFLQVPAKESNLHRDVILDLKMISFVWVGRLCDFKSYILMHTLKRVSLATHKFKKQIVFHIVGNGPFYSQIETYSKSLTHSFFKVNFQGEIALEELEEFLIKKADAVFAMGTSVLEGAKLGLPSIVLDYTYGEIKKNYKYRWLFNTKNYDLAHQINDEDLAENDQSIENMIKDFEKNYKVYSLKSLAYFNKNHTLSVTVEKLLKNIELSSLRYKTLEKEIKHLSLPRLIFNKIRGYK